MNCQEDSTPQTFAPFKYQDENRNYQQIVCSHNEGEKCLEKKKTEQIIITSDLNSADERWCSSCSAESDSELVSLDTKVIWQDIAHLIKCIYRETTNEFQENHSNSDIYKTKQYVQILTQLDAESLFHKLEMIILEYINEIRNQVLKRFQICLKSSNDGKLFISYFLDEYNTFIQAAKNVSTIISYLEEHYMKSFQLTWLLYNKHLYEKLIYTDKKIQHSMSTMIDLLQPSQDIDIDYSPAEYAQLLNRFLAFDEEMLEIDCLYKNCQAKLIPMSKSSLSKKRNPIGVMIAKKKRKHCKRTQTIQNTLHLNEETLNSLTTNTSDLSSPMNDSITLHISQQNSNVLSMCANEDEKTSLSISSADDKLLENKILNTNSTVAVEKSNQSDENNNMKQKIFHETLNNVSPIVNLQCKMDELKTCENTENQRIILNETNKSDQEKTLNDSTKRSKSNNSSSNNQQESSTAISHTSSISPDVPLPANLIPPPKPSLSAASKLTGDLRPRTISSLNISSTANCSPLLSKEFQSISFTAGTFGSITADRPTRPLSSKQKILSINLSRKSDLTNKLNSTLNSKDLDQITRQVVSTHELSTLLSSSALSNTVDDSQKSSVHQKDCDCCSCDLCSESDSSTTNSYTTQMSLPMTTNHSCCHNQCGFEKNERLNITLTQRTVENYSGQSKTLNTNKFKSQQHDSSIDDLVKYIGGNETVTQDSKSEKKKKKKRKRNKKNLTNEDIDKKKETLMVSKDPMSDGIENLSEAEESTKSKVDQPEKKNDISSIHEPVIISTDITSSKKADITQMSSNLLTECSTVQEDEQEMNWITISRKQSKHKATPLVAVPSSSSTPRIIANNIEQQRYTKSTKTKSSSISNIVESTPTRDILKTNVKLKQANTLVPQRIESLVKKHDSDIHQQKPQSPWNQHQESRETLSSTLVATAPVFVPSSSHILPAKVTDTAPFEEFIPMSHYDSDIHSDSTSLVQQHISKFSRVPGASNIVKHGCVERPSFDKHITSLPEFPSPIQSIGNPKLIWNNSSTIDPIETQWQHIFQERAQSSAIPTDFPLYDPFNSGAVLNILPFKMSSNEFGKYLDNLQTPQNDDIDEMNALDQEIEKFKRSCTDDVLTSPNEQL